MSDFDLKWNGDEFFVEVKKVNAKAMLAAGYTVERAAKESFGKGASRPDFTKRKTKKGAMHRPSAPGFAPNVEDGILKSSVSVDVDGFMYRNKRRVGATASKKGGDIEVSGFVGSDIDNMQRGLSKSKKPPKNINTAREYGFFLEVGTKNMRPRPWLLPALRKSAPDILRIFKKANS